MRVCTVCMEKPDGHDPLHALVTPLGDCSFDGLSDEEVGMPNQTLLYWSRPIEYPRYPLGGR